MELTILVSKQACPQLMGCACVKLSMLLIVGLPAAICAIYVKIMLFFRTTYQVGFSQNIICVNS